MTTPKNPALQKLLKQPPQFFIVEPTLTSDSKRDVSSTSKLEFSQVHLESRSETPVSKGTQHEKRERELGRKNSLLLKEYGKIELQLARVKKEIRSARENKEEKKEGILGKELMSLNDQKKEILENIKNLGRSEDSEVSSSDPSEDISSPYKSPQKLAEEIRNKIEVLNTRIQQEIAGDNEEQAYRLRRDVDKLYSELARISPGKARKEIDLPSPGPTRENKSGLGPEATKNDLINALIGNRTERQKTLHEYQNKLGGLKRDNAHEDEIRHLSKEIAELNMEIGFIDKLIYDMSSTPIDGKASLTQTLTRRGRPPIQTPAPESTSTSSAIKDRNADQRRSSFFLSAEKKDLFSNEGLKELDRIESEIEGLLEIFGELDADVKKWEKEVDEASHSFDRDDFNELLQDKKKALNATTLKLAKLFTEREKIEVLVFPDKSREQREIEREKFLARFKSERTLQLEARYKKKLAKLEVEVRGNCCSTAMYYVAGSAAFGTSFFVGNSLARAPFAGSAYAGSLLAAVLHVIAAGPMLKQILQKSWSAPAFVEFNNRVKLAGAKLGDLARGETSVKKYDSKNPQRAGKLTIDERLAEERPFSEILRDRFETEDASYFFYAANYLGKAAAAAGMATFMATGGGYAIATEWALHSILGAMSGAETVAGIQHRRSQNPKAELKAVPTQKLYAAEADAKESLLDDLNKALSAWQAIPNKSPDDMTGLELMKEIRRTTKALETAQKKSQACGTFGNEFVSQFKPGDPLSDTIGEILGRWVSVLPSAILSEYLRDARRSGDPLQVFLGHALPAVLLISPPGFAARAVYVAFFRSIIQAIFNGRAGHLTAQDRENDDEGAGFTGNPNEYDEQRQDWM